MLKNKTVLGQFSPTVHCITTDVKKENCKPRFELNILK